jgi:nitroreductase
MSEKGEVIINGYKHVEYTQQDVSNAEMLINSRDYFGKMDKRRSVREFSNEDIPKEVIENIIRTASTAPSGAHKQPWSFCAVSNPDIKTKIREAAEQEERESYDNRMSDRWLKDLAPLATDMNKPFLEEAPWLIIAFKRAYEYDKEGVKHNNYYVNESIGIACGMLITAIHNAGLVTLTHTPSPMDFLAKILNRPANERAFLLLPVGKPAQPVYVPDLQRKPLAEVGFFYE